ncbi:hypothetical protein O7632_31445 [Solwaraspora sp. WMMD406]|uniref:hypothetical protein n=1 Tax=Solwaraspora sp. WMMD406 TaxID=3016095 RepID=UPI00241691EB|nr:hypothetical protein [Solwaraspora sp. WMMD406]MDG4768573.1 hypothetical protein [Solwaraspora sp. WMMD406]
MLDRLALLAYLDGSAHVAAPIHEVTQDGVRFGVTAVSVVETLVMVSGGKDRQLLRRLLELDACAVLDTPGGSWQELSYWREVTGRVDLATRLGSFSAYDDRRSVSAGGRGAARWAPRPKGRRRTGWRRVGLTDTWHLLVWTVVHASRSGTLRLFGPFEHPHRMVMSLSGGR